jgi:alkylation response protein AidB-like acyl-CoA dehydrogenase
MSTVAPTSAVLKGGEWIIRESKPEDIFIPEDFNEEQKMILEMCTSFVASEVLPNIERIDQLEPGLMPSLMDKAGEQGLLGISIPEE